MDKQQVLTKMTDAGLVAVVRASNACLLYTSFSA